MKLFGYFTGKRRMRLGRQKEVLAWFQIGTVIVREDLKTFLIAKFADSPAILVSASNPAQLVGIRSLEFLQK
jgi:hypothetical protein